jgi:uncharacterized protein YjbJ (UPF0337 family)
MHTAMIIKARCKQGGGRLRKWWGQVTGDRSSEFTGDLIIVEAKLEEYYRRSKIPVFRRPSQPRLFIERRRAFHVVT